MKEEEYNVGYYLDMVEVMRRTEELIEQYSSIKSKEVRWSIMELIAIYYSKPFTSSNRAYKRADGSKHKPHKILVDEIEFTENERKVHDLAYDWRNGYIAHSDQEKRNQEIELRRDENGRVIGFEGTSSSEVMPIFDFHLDILRSNITKIKGLLWTKIYEPNQSAFTTL